MKKALKDASLASLGLVLKFKKKVGKKMMMMKVQKWRQ